jgi:hypothetical protein
MNSINNKQIPKSVHSLAISIITAGFSKIVMMNFKTGVYLLPCPSKIIQLDCYHNPFGVAAVPSSERRLADEFRPGRRNVGFYLCHCCFEENV